MKWMYGKDLPDDIRPSVQKVFVGWDSKKVVWLDFCTGTNSCGVPYRFPLL